MTLADWLRAPEEASPERQCCYSERARLIWGAGRVHPDQPPVQGPCAALPRGSDARADRPPDGHRGAGGPWARGAGHRPSARRPAGAWHSRLALDLTWPARQWRRSASRGPASNGFSGRNRGRSRRPTPSGPTSSSSALADVRCAQCLGRGIRGRGNPCGCVLRKIFRICAAKYEAARRRRALQPGALVARGGGTEGGAHLQLPARRVRRRLRPDCAACLDSKERRILYEHILGDLTANELSAAGSA